MKKAIVIAMVVSSPLFAKATFRSSFDRYLSGHDLLRMLQDKFPRGGRIFLEIPKQDRDTVALSNPASGSPVIKSPTPGYVKWYLQYLSRAVDHEFYAVDEHQPGSLERYMGKEALAAIRQQYNGEEILNNPKEIEFGLIFVPNQQLIIKHLIHDLIGPGIVQNEVELIKKIDMAILKHKGITVYDGLKKAVILIASRDEFLTY